MTVFWWFILFLWIGHVFLFICTHCSILLKIATDFAERKLWKFWKVSSYFSFQTYSCHRTSSLISLLWSLKGFLGIWRHIFSPGLLIMIFFPSSPVYTAAFKCLGFPKSLILTSLGALAILLYSLISSHRHLRSCSVLVVFTNHDHCFPQFPLAWDLSFAVSISDLWVGWHRDQLGNP